MASPDTAIRVRSLRKSYTGRDVVGGIDLEVRSGEIFAFLGPNGAGKTTTVEILEGFRDRTEGEVTVLGEDPRDAGRAWRNRIGVVLQESEPEPQLTARECVRLYGGYYDRPLPPEVTLDLVGLTDRANARVSALSGGQRRRLDVALALVGDPELVFLDEPTTGFDPSARRQAWDVIAGLRELGKTVFLTTHYMDEAEFLADRIAVIAQGQIVAEGTPATLAGRDHAATEIVFSLPAGVTIEALPSSLRGSVERLGDRVLVRAMAPMPALQALSAWAVALDYELADISVRRPTLEDAYLRLTREAP